MFIRIFIFIATIGFSSLGNTFEYQVYFNQSEFEGGGSLNGYFTGEDLNNDGILSSFDNEIYQLRTTLLGNSELNNVYAFSHFPTLIYVLEDYVDRGAIIGSLGDNPIEGFEILSFDKSITLSTGFYSSSECPSTDPCTVIGNDTSDVMSIGNIRTAISLPIPSTILLILPFLVYLSFKKLRSLHRCD